MTSEQKKTKDRCQRLERCLEEVGHLLYTELRELSGIGEEDSEEFKKLKRLLNRVNRTLR
jgi:hypothetical protein